MKRQKIFRLLSLRKAICFVLILITLQLVLLIYELAYYLAIEGLPNVLKNILDYAWSKLYIFCIKLHHRLLGRHKRLDRNEDHPKPIDVLENFYYDEEDDMQRSKSNLNFLPSDLGNHN